VERLLQNRQPELSNEHGLLLCAEAGGPGPPLHQVPVDALKAQGNWISPEASSGRTTTSLGSEETACAAHIYGKKLVDMEAFTSWRHWQDGPFELKPLADRAFCRWHNHITVSHVCAQPSATDRPGWVYHAGTHIGPSIAWWPKAGAWIDYLSRCSYLLSSRDCSWRMSATITGISGFQLRPAEAHRSVTRLRL